MQIRNMKTILCNLLLISVLYVQGSVIFENGQYSEDVFKGIERVNNGLRANVGQFPHSVFIHALRDSSAETTYCMGILVGEDKVLTTASCLEGTRGIRLIFGTIDTANVDTQESEDIIFHQYPDGMVNDHAEADLRIIKLPHPIAETSTIGIATLPAADDLPPVAGTKVTNAGFGKKSSIGAVTSDLLYSTGAIDEAANCPAAIIDDTNVICYTLNDNINGWTGSCSSGDYGSGVEDQSGIVVGITIYGDCSDDANKNGAIFLAPYVEWINAL